MKMKKFAAIAAAAALVISALTGCGSGSAGGGQSAGAGADGSNGELTYVSMAFCTWTGYSPMFIAKEKGYFKDAGINMDI